YEQLVANPQPELARLLDFLGLDEPSEGWLATAASEVDERPPKWAKLPRAELEALDRACEAATRRLRQLELDDRRVRGRASAGKLPPGPSRFARQERRLLE